MSSAPKKKKRSAARAAPAVEVDTFKMLADALDVGTLGPQLQALPKPEPQPATNGRPTLYSDEVARDICAEIANGRSIDQIGELEAMPCARTIRRWQADDADFQQRISAAFRVGLESLLHDAAAAVKFGAAEIADKRLAVDTFLAVHDRMAGPIKQREDMIEAKRNGDDATIIEGEIIDTDPFEGPLKEWEKQTGIKSKALAAPAAEPTPAPAG